MAMGLSNTHAAVTATDMGRLARMVPRAGISPDLGAAVAVANTVRHAFDLVAASGFSSLTALVRRKVLVNARSFTAMPRWA
jgi:cobalamin biosynthesis protein CbiD